MTKILIGVNTLTVLSREAYSNHCQFWFRLGRNYPDYQFAFNTPSRATIDNMRNFSARAALENKFDYLMFIDDDVLVPPDSLKDLIACDADIAAGWTIIRGWPYENMFFKEDEKGLCKWNDPEIPADGILPVAAVDFSYVLIKCSLLERVPAPFFITGPRNTEDIYFCVKAKKYVPDVRIVVNTNVKTAHILGNEMIMPENREAYKRYMKEAYPELAPDPERVNKARGDEYLKMIEEPSEENVHAYYHEVA